MDNTLVIEPYVDIVVGNKSVLLYNPLSGDRCVSSEQTIVSLFARDNSNLYSFDVSAQIVNDKKFIEFVHDISRKGIGKVLQSKVVAPVQLNPAHNLQFVSVTNKSSKLQISHLNIVDVALYLNGATQKQTYADAYKQFLCCKKGNGHIELNDIVSFLEPLRDNNSIVRLHLLGGNIFEYPQIETLLHFLEDNFPKAVLYIHCNFTDLTEDCVLTSEHKHKFIVTIYPDDDKERLSMYTSLECEFQFVVESENDLENVEQHVSNYHIGKYSIVPYYNGLNMKFFEENVFTTADDILQQPVSMNEIQKSKAINTSNFGRIIIDLDGKVYDNINFPPIGQCNDSVVQVAEKEISEKLRWFSIRNNIEPCKHCLYRYLCSPMGNLEYFMNKNNLCHAYQD